MAAGHAAASSIIKALRTIALGHGSIRVCRPTPEWRTTMSRHLERLLQKAKAARPQPPSLPDNALPIVAERVERVPAGIDRLIAAGKLAEADRPRCVSWLHFVNRGGPLSPEQLAFVRAQVEFAKEQVPDVAAAFVVTMGPVVECLNPPEEILYSAAPCRSPVDRL
jgi:hypothetical protein